MYPSFVPISTLVLYLIVLFYDPLALRQGDINYFLVNGVSPSQSKVLSRGKYAL